MSALMQILDESLDAQSIEQIGSQLGVDQATAQKAVGLAIPVLIGALSRNAASPQGAQALETAVLRDHDGSILDDLGGLLGGQQSGLGQSILTHILGGRQSTVQQGIGRTTGLDAGSVGQLLAILAPIVMGALARARQQQGGGLDSILGGAQAHVEQRAPQATDFLTQLLDGNHDGSAVDDVARIGVNLLGGLFGRK